MLVKKYRKILKEIDKEFKYGTIDGILKIHAFIS